MGSSSSPHKKQWSRDEEIKEDVDGTDNTMEDEE
jgi:hypothetical protein